MRKEFQAISLNKWSSNPVFHTKIIMLQFLINMQVFTFLGVIQAMKGSDWIQNRMDLTFILIL